MARRFTTGAEERDIVSLWDTCNSGGTRAGDMVAGGRTDQIDWAPRTGAAMYCLNSDQSLRNLTTDNPTELYFGFAIRFPVLAAANFFTVFTDDPGVFSNYVSLALTATGAIAWTRTGTAIATSPSSTVSIATWYYIECWIKPLDSNGRLTLKIDGSTPTNMDFTGDTTAEEQFISGYQIQGVSPTLHTSFDDIVVNDTSGGVNDTWPGLVRLLPMRTASAGQYNQWVRGGVDLGSDAAQLRNGSFDFSMLQTAEADYKSTFVPEIPDLPAGATIKNICINSKARVQAGSGVIAPMVRANGTDNISTDQNLISNWKYYQKAWNVNPEDSAAWEEADLANLQIGISS